MLIIRALSENLLILSKHLLPLLSVPCEATAEPTAVFLCCRSVTDGRLDAFVIALVSVMAGCPVVNVLGIFCSFWVVTRSVKSNIEGDAKLVGFTDDGSVLSCPKDK